MTAYEQAVIGSAIEGNPQGVLALADDEFTDARLKTAAATIRDMHRRGEPIDLVTVSGKLHGRIPGSWLSALICPAPLFASYYAGLVRDEYIQRRTAEALSEAKGALEAPGGMDSRDELLASLYGELSAVPDRLDVAAEDHPPTIADLMEIEYPMNPLIPGLIHRGERIVLVAGEGSGKSVLLTQFGIALAGGCHPFTGKRIAEPMRVLLIDAENSPAQSQRRFQWVGDRFHHAELGWAHQIVHYHRPEGLDLPGADRGWFHKVAASASPDLILITPAYKVTRGDPQKDSEVLKLLQVIDEVRVKHDAAVIIETHATHGQDQAGDRIMRPYGSSVWLRWPEIGLGMAHHKVNGMVMKDEYALGHWRGMREERDWPDVIRRGKAPELPWYPIRPDYGTAAIAS